MLKNLTQALTALLVLTFISCSNKNQTEFTVENYEGPFLVATDYDTLVFANITKDNNRVNFEWTEEFENPYMVSISLNKDFYSSYSYFEKGKYTISTLDKQIVVSSFTNDQIAEIEKFINENQEVKSLLESINKKVAGKKEIEDKLYALKSNPDYSKEEYNNLTLEWLDLENGAKQERVAFRELRTKILYEKEPSLAQIIYLMNNRHDFVYDVSSAEKILEIAKKVNQADPNKFTERIVNGFADMHQSKVRLEMTKPGSQYQDIIAPDKDGNTIKLSELLANNKIVLLKFWASWCGPCVRSIPETLELSEKFGDKGFQVYAISLDDNKDSWLNAVKKHKIENWVNTSELKGWNGTEHNKYGVTGIPNEVLISADGKILGVNLKKEWIDKYVTEHCSAKTE